MKKSLGLVLCLFTVTVSNAFAAATPITSDVWLKSDAFAEKLTLSLMGTTKPTRLKDARGGQIVELRVGNGLRCRMLTPAPHPRFPDPASSFQCTILKTGGWKFLGSESYGSGSNGAFSLALFEALNVPEERQEEVSLKTIELERPDGQGGTERNQLLCMNPTPEGAKLGFRVTCQLLNAL